MTPVVVSAVLTVSLFLYNYFRLGIELMESLRNAIIMLALCVVFSLPVGRWETRLVENTEPITAELIYVMPCDHHIEAGGHATYITPAYTSLFTLCFNEDEHVVQFCPICYTREEAVETYLAQR